MAPSKIPYPDRGQGIPFFCACCPSHPLDLQTSASMLLARFSVAPPTVGEPGEFGSGWLCLGRVLRCASTTHAIVIIQVERFLGRGVGMQRALVVGMSLVCLSTVGMTGGWVLSGGEEEALGFSAPGISVRGGITVNF
jgi:hypothetical protein